GMWAHKLSVQDYQDLIDRGWRRSGKYCYKPTMNKTCCPQYTIKCNALEFKLSKSQKKVLKRMQRYLAYGDVKGSSEDKKHLENGSSEGGENCSQLIHPAVLPKHDLSNVTLTQPSKAKTNSDSNPIKTNKGEGDGLNISSSKSHEEDLGNEAITTDESNRVQLPKNNRENTILNPKLENKTPKPGIGADLNRPSQKKAKDIRQERREAKLAAKLQDAELRGETLMESEAKKNKNNISKSIEDFLDEPMPAKPSHKLELRLVRVNSSAFKATFNDAYKVFKKYQMTIHKENEEECERSSYINFLVDGPLAMWYPRRGGPTEGFGSFHQQYWLDDKLIAVGVLDVLPQCISSVYLFYDPDFAFLSLGTYASLRETALVREIHRQGALDFKWYYMGFYIHSCPKMRYKGQYTPSYLLCPDTYTWQPIEPCIPLLDASKFARLNQDQNVKDENCKMDISKVLCLYQREEILYHQYAILNPESEDQQEVREYSNLVGSKCAQSMLLYRS
ncbi:unnamed protein product, partial [Meganyctiphanes norvegica]